MVTKTADIDRLCKRMAEIVEECVVEEFTEWAKQDDEYLRSNDGFIDHTGNLRSSLGAAVIKDTVIQYMTPFAQVLGGSKGSQAGRSAVESLAQGCQNRIAKVMVAGMDYAHREAFVEALYSLLKDVLESRRIQCEREAQSVMERAMRKAEQRIKALK